MKFLSRWRPLHLGIAWVSYWVALFFVALGPALIAASRVTGDGKHGTIGLSFDNAVFRLKISDATTTLYEGSAHVLTLALWLAVPPLLLWLMWLVARGRRVTGRAAPSPG